MSKKDDEKPNDGMENAFPELCRVDQFFKKTYLF
jgi:hypothetical protein